MTSITTVRTEDCYPRPNARPVNQKLAQNLARSMDVLGFLPTRPLELTKDGDIYWVIDGGHRLEAARMTGITEVPAVVVDISEPDALVHEGAANICRPDTEAERWARLQQFFGYGVLFTQGVEVATGYDDSTAEKAYEVVNKLADPVAAEDLTIEQALAAHEFLDDDDSFRAVMNAGRDWREVYKALRSPAETDEDTGGTEDTTDPYAGVVWRDVAFWLASMCTQPANTTPFAPQSDALRDFRIKTAIDAVR